MSYETITLKRSELYERVWTTPMRTIAKELKLSDVGLAKLCRRHDIPLPGRGYWVRIQFGHKPERVPLPPAQNPSIENIVFHRVEPRPTPRIVVKDDRPIPIIVVTDDRPIAHPLAQRIDKSILKSTDERGLLVSKSGISIPIKVSAACWPRAIRIIDALFSALDTGGCTLEWTKPFSDPLFVVRDSEKFRLILTEGVRRSNHKLTADDLAQQKLGRWWNIPKWDYAPTGELRLTLESCAFPYEVHRTWSDGKVRKIEKHLGEIIVACEYATNAVKRERQGREEASRRREEEQKREAEVALRRAEYERKAKAVMQLCQSWQQSKSLKNFAASLQEKANDETASEVRQDLQQMAEWTLHHAEYVDPLTHLKCTIEQFKDPPWTCY